jgi:hypothetical protein
MVRNSVRKIPTGGRLAKLLSDSAALPAFVPTLTARRLKLLIDEVGVADAGMLVEYCSEKQLTTVFDEAVWQRSVPGTPERFDPEAFLEWADMLLEVGDAFAVERLRALGDDLIVTAFVGLLRIADLDKQIMETSTYVKQSYVLPDSVELTELYGDFEVAPRREEDWEVVQRLLSALHVEAPDFLRATLTRCHLPESMVATRDVGAAQLDAEGDRSDRRRLEGFVDPVSAAAFLDAARTDPLADIVAVRGYDLEMEAWFDRARRSAAEAILTPRADGPARLGHAGSPARNPDVESDADAAHLEAFADGVAEDAAVLEALVAAVEVERATRSAGRLAGPSDEQGADSATPLARLLARCAEEDPVAASQRMQEAAWLSNVLMAGARLEGRWLDEHQSVEAVMATANLGLDVCPDYPLEEPPGLIGLFRIGWHTLRRLPEQVVEALVSLPVREDLDAVIGARSWIVADVLKALGDPELDDEIEAGRFEGVHEALRMFALVLEEAAVDRLLHLVDGLPTDLRPERAGRRPMVRFIERREDLGEIARFVRDICAHVKR